MTELENCIEHEKQQVKKIIRQAENYLSVAPEGSLRIAQKIPAQYYWVNKTTNSQGKYIRKSQKELAYTLAQKDYAIKIRELSIKKLNALEKINNTYSWNDIANFHETFSMGRQAMIKNFVLSDMEYAQNWEQDKFLQIEELEMTKTNAWNKNYEYVGGADKYPIDDDGILSAKGEPVRSKSEKIFADTLYKMGIPYIYEMPVRFKGWGYVNPDFTVLNVRTRQEYYWEHFGMMDNPEYAEKAIKKIAMYEKNGIYQGKKLLLTYETKNRSMNTKQLEAFITEFLL